MQHIRESLAILDYPGIHDMKDDEISNILYKKSTRRDNFTQWIACKIKNLDHKSSPVFDNKALRGIFKTIVYEPVEGVFKSFFEGVCSREIQRKIWEATLDKLCCSKIVCNATSLDEKEEFITEILSSNSFEVSEEWRTKLGIKSTEKSTEFVEKEQPNDNETEKLIQEALLMCQDTPEPSKDKLTNKLEKTEKANFHIVDLKSAIDFLEALQYLKDPKYNNY